MLAQMAIQEGPHAADNILAQARGEQPRPFQPHMRGEFVSVGPRWGVGWMFGTNLTGHPGHRHEARHLCEILAAGGRRVARLEANRRDAVDGLVTRPLRRTL